MGVLARIPWHAAAHTVDGRRHYALERVVFSYAVSARLYCDLAFTTPIPRTTAGLVIGDPDTHGRASVLHGARTEAVAIQQSFYPRATYLGRSDQHAHPAGAGTVAEVTTWLADERPDAGVVLHAACHGTVRPGTDAQPTSYLELADGELAAEDLVRTLAVRPTRELALAVLAACNSGVPGRGYDEAFSIATALLAAGTRSVISSLWKVPDAATSVLMFLFHDRLRDLDPADALHAAQLWMLQPDRTPPSTMPATLQARLADTDPSDIVAWAGFAHAG
jgi:CHAT domain-containing protein